MSLCFLLFFLIHASALHNRVSQHSRQEDPFRQAREADLVVDLPGQPHVEFAHYAGYVTVNASHGRALFYWFFEATSNPHSKPLLLWLNGGPGCSSVAYGAAEEIGPFRVGVNGTGLSFNTHSWNHETNLLFIESPAGVGFSYSNVSSDFKNFGDQLTAEDTYAFLAGWFERFPQYKQQEFFLAGESYAGHYVPQLAEIVNERNKEASEYPFFNLKGFMVGNPSLNQYYDIKGLVEFAWSHGVISDQTYRACIKDCNFTAENETTSCIKASETLLAQYQDINIYNLYAPTCHSSGSASRNTPQSRNLHGRFPYSAGAGYDPCIDNYVKIYFNRPEVQKALHANVTGISYNWSPCSSVLSSWTDSPSSMLPTFKKLIAEGLRVWVFSGDTDGRLPVISTRYGLDALKLTITDPWRAWYHKQEVAGWTQSYEGLTYVTVRGAGHMVPVFAPSRALVLFRSFRDGKALPAAK